MVINTGINWSRYCSLLDAEIYLAMLNLNLQLLIPVPVMAYMSVVLQSLPLSWFCEGLMPFAVCHRSCRVAQPWPAPDPCPPLPTPSPWIVSCPPPQRLRTDRPLCSSGRLSFSLTPGPDHCLDTCHRSDHTLVTMKGKIEVMISWWWNFL